MLIEHDLVDSALCKSWIRNSISSYRCLCRMRLSDNNSTAENNQNGSRSADPSLHTSILSHCNYFDHSMYEASKYNHYANISLVDGDTLLRSGHHAW